MLAVARTNSCSGCMHACRPRTCVCDTGRFARCSSHYSRLSLPTRAASGAATWAGAPALSGKGRCRARHPCYPHNRPHPVQDRPQNQSAASASAAGTRSRTPVGSITASSSAQSSIWRRSFSPHSIPPGRAVCPHRFASMALAKFKSLPTSNTSATPTAVLLPCTHFTAGACRPVLVTALILVQMWLLSRGCSRRSCGAVLVQMCAF